MKKLRSILPYLIINILMFYLLPLLIKDTGSGMFIMLLLIPILCLGVSFFYGIKRAFDFYYPLVTMMIFIPTIFIYYNESAIIYIFIYGILSLSGSVIGDLFNTKGRV